MNGQKLIIVRTLSTAICRSLRSFDHHVGLIDNQAGKIGIMSGIVGTGVFPLETIIPGLPFLLRFPFTVVLRITVLVRSTHAKVQKVRCQALQAYRYR